MKKLPLIVAALFVFLTIGFFAFNNYIYKEKQDENPIERYEATLNGEYVCLPHRDSSGPKTLECAFGIKTEAGEYYALDLNTESNEELQIGDQFTATGTITPIEMLSTDHWQKYNVSGIFTVEGTVEKL